MFQVSTSHSFIRVPSNLKRLKKIEKKNIARSSRELIFSTPFEALSLPWSISPETQSTSLHEPRRWLNVNVKDERRGCQTQRSSHLRISFTLVQTWTLCHWLLVFVILIMLQLPDTVY